MGLALGTALKFYTSVEKELKLKVIVCTPHFLLVGGGVNTPMHTMVIKFWGLIPTFVEVTWGKLVGGLFAPLS